MAKAIPHAVQEKLGYYVYLYVNPIDNTVFYVGKGRNARAVAHLEDPSENRKADLVRRLRSLGKEPRIELLAHGLKTEEEAARLESATIDVFGLVNLTNEVRGRGSRQVGRMTLDQAIALYTAEDAVIDDPCILIRINRLYRYDMSDEELYHATRGVWRVGSRRDQARYALAVFRGVVREVYRIEQWVPAGSTHYPPAVQGDIAIPGRWEFVGERAQEGVRSKYIDKSVERYFPKGSQNPVTYVNC
jgi:hypothetical protein